MTNPPHDLLDVDDLDAMEVDPALIDVDRLIATARAYHEQRANPAAARDALASSLTTIAGLVGGHYNDLVSGGVPFDLAEELAGEVHRMLLTATAEGEA